MENIIKTLLSIFLSENQILFHGGTGAFTTKYGVMSFNNNICFTVSYSKNGKLEYNIHKE